MGTTAEKITYLNTTKQNLKTVINTTGAGLTDSSTFRSYANVLNDKILGAINGDVDLFEEYPKVSGNGTDLSLNGVVEGKMSITPQGVSSQDGEPTPTTPVPVKSVTGENSLVLQNENLFDKTSATNGKMINRNTGNPDNESNTTCSDYINVIGTDRVIMSGSTISYGNGGAFYDIDKNFITGFSSSAIKRGLTIPDNVYYLRFNLLTTDIDTVMLIKGSTAPTTYVEHEEQKYQLSLGNVELNSSPDGTIRDQIVGSSDVSYNLYKTVNKTLSQNGVNITIENGIVTFNGTSTGSFDLFLNPSNDLYSLKSGEYTFSTKVISGSYSGTVGKYVRNNSTSSNIIDGGLIDATRTRTIEANDNCLSYIYIGNNAVFNNYKVIIQLNEGSEAKPYAPYGQVGMWWKREYIGKTTDASGSTSITINDMVSDSGFYSYYGGTLNGKTITYASAISGTNTILYQKSQYTDVPITDTTLISQLNDIYNNAHSYNGVTNITTTYEDGNEQLYLDIEALKNVWDTSL